MGGLRFFVPAGLAALLWLFFACEKGGGGTEATSTGTGAGGCPAMGPPQAQFILTIHAMVGPLPADTTLRVRWSAGAMPEFVLNDPSTHMTLDEGSNVVCEVAADAGTPPVLEELICELWTSGVTEIEVEATGHVTHLETLTADMIDDCDRPLQTQVDVELKVDLDAGP